jgi:oligosaccharyltransferase complex subunit beta
LTNVRHHRQGEQGQHGIYRIKDDMIYEMDVSEWRNGQWNVFEAKDIQVEAVMLDPYIRKTMKIDSSSGSNTHYKASFKLPDQYGVFTFKLNYRRHGYTWLEASDLVEVRPFRHNEYPRFLLGAYPYYVNAFSMIIGFVLVSIFWLFDAETEKIKTN